MSDQAARCKCMNPEHHTKTTANQPAKPDELRDKIAEALSDDYACTRVWEAWGVGTMTSDDFVALSDTERVDEIVDLIQAHTNQVLRELLEGAETLYENEHPTEDGVPVETYGYEAKHNQAIKSVVDLIKSKIEGDV